MNIYIPQIIEICDFDFEFVKKFIMVETLCYENKIKFCNFISMFRFKAFSGYFSSEKQNFKNVCKCMLL